MLKKRCVIVGGADINNYEYLKTILKGDDYLIFCDSGLKHLEKLGLEADLIVGDFDSHANPHSQKETIVLPREKDDTDTMYGIKEGIARGFNEFLMIGVIGQRLDHSLANLYALLYLKNRHKKAMIVDDYSDIEIVANETAVVENKYPYFSLLNIFADEVQRVNIYDAKYSIVDANIKSEYQYAVSNEVAKNKAYARIEVDGGKLLLIKDR